MPKSWSKADAEAELQAAGAKVMALEDAVERAREVVYAIENEAADTPAAEADVVARINVAEAELERLEGELADAKEDHRIVTERWQDAGYLPSDEVEDGDDDGWPTRPEEPS
jgi:peptidoglycan hydrolase CwlO-like protein